MVGMVCTVYEMAKLREQQQGEGERVRTDKVQWQSTWKGIRNIGLL